MFVMWGSKGVVADLGAQGSRHCPTCEKERTFHLMLQYTVRHFWYAFRWVTGKQYGSVCEVCKRGDKLDARTVESSLKKSPIPFGARWGWAFLVGLLVITGVFMEMGESSRRTSREDYLATPKTGDRYLVNAASLLKTPQSKYMYAVLRVRSVNAGSVEFDAPTVFYSGVTGPKNDMRDGKLDQPGYFAATPLTLSRDEIARIHQEHAIHSIDRAPRASLAAAR